MFRNPQGYEQLMGRWSRRLAVPFIEFAGVENGERVLDVGAGTGSLSGALADRFDDCEIVAVERIEAYVNHARERLAGARIRFEVGDACALRFAGASFDRVLALLVVNFIDPPERGVAEMRRVARPGGTVAACGWDFGSGRALSGPLWDAIVAVAPEMEPEHSRHTPLGRGGEHAALWKSCGLRDVEELAIPAAMEFRSFDDFWLPFSAPSTPSSASLAALSADRRAAVKEKVRRRLLGAAVDGPFTFESRAFAVRGTVPKA
jgi:SAM-dependent methyltransferase